MKQPLDLRDTFTDSRRRIKKRLAVMLSPLLFGATAVIPAVAADLPVPATTTLERLTLRQAEQLFLERNRELRIARRITEGAEADILSAAAPPNPALSISTSRISPSNGIGPGKLKDKYVDTVIGLSQLIERGNKRELRTEAAQFNAAAARNDENDVIRQQRLVLQAAYYDLKLAQERFRISDTTADLFDKSVAASERRLSAGDIAPTELSRIQVDASRARNDARNARAERERNQLLLGYLLGADRDAGRIVAADPWPSSIAQSPPTSIDDIIQRRNDVRAAQDRVSAAEKNRDLARSLRTRDVTAGIQYERFPGDTSNNSYGFSFSIPIFARYQYNGEIRRAEVELLTAQENLDRVRALALGELSRVESDLAAADDRVRRINGILLPAAEKAANGAEFAHSRGAIGLMDLLDSRRQLYAAQLESISAYADLAKALAAKRGATTAIPE